MTNRRSALLALLLPWLFGLAALISGMTHEVNELWPDDLRNPAAQAAREKDWTDNPNIPSWTQSDARDFPNCRKSTGEEKPFSFTHYLVVDQGNDRLEMPFDEAIRVTQDAPDYLDLNDGQTMTSANDVWVIGVCNDERTPS